MDWSEIIIAAVGLVFSAVVLPLVKAAFAWLKSRTKNEAVRAALDEARTVADNVVASLKATMVDGLKEKSADGKLNADEAREIAKKAMDMFLSDLSARSLEMIKCNADNMESFVGNLLEARLLALREGK